MSTAARRVGGAVLRVLVGLPATLLALPLRCYRRWISPAVPPHCRFTPTCSAYGLQALRTRGAIVGTALTVRRLARCHPFHPGGVDPVPVRRSGPAGTAPQSGDRQASVTAQPCVPQTGGVPPQVRPAPSPSPTSRSGALT